MIQAHEFNEENKWRRTREIIKMIYNTNISKRSQAKTSAQILPLPSDNISQYHKPNSTLKDFKDACKKMGLAWNPVN